MTQENWTEEQAAEHERHGGSCWQFAEPIVFALRAERSAREAAEAALVTARASAEVCHEEQAALVGEMRTALENCGGGDESHYAHFDHEGKAGNACPACYATSIRRERVRSVLALPVPAALDKLKARVKAETWREAESIALASWSEHGAENHDPGDAGRWCQREFERRAVALEAEKDKP